MKTILIVDDQRKVVDLLKETLEEAGFGTLHAFDGNTGLNLALNRTPDLAILDIKLPGVSGIEVCRALRQSEKTRRIPILMLTGQGDEADKVAAFELGADDFVTKPFSPREIVLRVRAILRRMEPDTEEKMFAVDGLTVDVPGFRVMIDGGAVEVTATEFRLLVYLLQNRGKVQSREVLLDKVWGIEADVFTRTVDMHINRLRDKLGPYGEKIETARGMGYRFL